MGTGGEGRSGGRDHILKTCLQLLVVGGTRTPLGSLTLRVMELGLFVEDSEKKPLE